jgi:hypothetical protein
MNPKAFQERFVEWTETLSALNATYSSIDGKVSRHIFDGDQNTLHLVNAFAIVIYIEYRIKKHC